MLSIRVPPKMKDATLLLLLSIVLIGACKPSATRPTPIPLPATVPQLIDLVEREMDKYPPPTDAIRALGDFGSAAAPALDVITPWLDYRADRGYTNSVAAETLAKMGPVAAPALPQLVSAIQWLQDAESLELRIARISMIAALGHIGPNASAAVPTPLAELLYADSADARFVAAWSIAQITDEDWPDADVILVFNDGMVAPEGERRLVQDSAGDYIIVKRARAWWEQEGRHIDWPELEDSA